jgi:hypothetical protein
LFALDIAKKEVQMRTRKLMILCLMVLLTAGLTIPTVQARQESKKYNSIEALIIPDLFKNMAWRNIGPANMMGRVADVEGVPGNPNIVYAGLWLFERKPWTFTSGDEDGGVFRSIDGGQTCDKGTVRLFS